MVWKTVQVSVSQRHIPEKKIKNQTKKTSGHDPTGVSESGSGYQLHYALRLGRCPTSQEDK